LAIGDRYGYDPYGNTTYHSGTTPNPWGYAAGYTDSTGLIKFGARYYDPAIARWTQLEPLASAQLAVSCSSPFAYAGDNPVNSSDPSGYCDWGLFFWGMWHILHAIAWAVGTGILMWYLYAGMLASFGWNWAVFITWIFVAIRMLPVWFAGYWLLRQGVRDIKRSDCFWWVLWWLHTH